MLVFKRIDLRFHSCIPEEAISQWTCLCEFADFTQGIGMVDLPRILKKRRYSVHENVPVRDGNNFQWSRSVRGVTSCLLLRIVRKNLPIREL